MLLSSEDVNDIAGPEIFNNLFLKIELFWEYNNLIPESSLFEQLLPDKMLFRELFR